MLFRTAPLSCLILFCLFPASSLAGAPPVVTGLSPRGWKAGANEITLQGANFTPATRLLIEIPGATAVLKPEVAPTANQVQWIVTLPAEVAAGAYEVRTATADGISLPHLVLVDALPNVVEIEPNNNLDQAQAITLPAALEGRLTGVESDLVAFDGKQGQRIVAELAGRRLGGNYKPVLKLLNANRLELQMARGERTRGGDARLIATLPADGRYFIELRDLLYRGDNSQYRLLIGDLQTAGGHAPLGGRRGAALPLEFFGGTLPAGLTTSVQLPPDPLALHAALLLPPAAMPAGLLISPLPWPIALSDIEEVAEVAPPEGQRQTVPLPGVVNGRIQQPGEKDQYQFTVTPVSRLQFKLEAETLGTPLDAIVELKNDQGAVLLTQDDSPGSADPDFLYVTPAGQTTLNVTVTDARGRGGDEFAYRLTVRPAPEGDFSLALLNPLVNVPAGGSAAVKVEATRRDYTGPIRLKLDGEVPPGVVLSGAEIPAGATATFLSLTAPMDAPLTAGLFRIVGEAGPLEAPLVTRTAELAETPAHAGFPWLADRLGGAIAAPGLFALEVTPTEPIVRGLEFSALVKVRRNPGETGPINLTLQTSQSPLLHQPLVQPVPNLVIPENVSEGTIKLNVPPNAIQMPVSLLVTGQLLNATDKKTPVATAEAASVATRIVAPFQAEFTPPAELRRGVRHVLTGKITRAGKFAEPVTITLTGLPGTVRSMPVLVPADQQEFQVPLLISPAQAAGAIPNLQLTAVPTTATLVAPPRPIPLTATAEDPPASLEIFEDGADFVANLTEGAGTATLEETDKQTGTQSVRIQGEQKFRSTLPGLGVAIAENPGPGQYRYLRFAWKKTGGAGVMLQLGVNNQFGAASTTGTDFRYVAGVDKYGTKAIRIADQPPAEWTVITRDLFADHGAFTLTGIALTNMGAADATGDTSLFDHIWLAKTPEDFPAAK